MFSDVELTSILGRLTGYFRSRGAGCDAEDLASEAVSRCVPAWQRGQTIRLSYVWLAARTTWVDYQRRRHGMVTCSLDELAVDPSYEMDDPEEYPEWFQDLAPEDREILVLRVRGYDNRGAAEVRGMSRKTVWGRIRAVRTCLSEHYDPEGALKRA